MSITYFSRKTLLFIALLFLVPVAVSAVTLTGNVLFRGNLAITGALSKGGGTFVIDHPLDPKNKLLYHSFVESPDVLNIYDGLAQFNEKGEATITLPSYFTALNTNFQYQFFPLYEPMPNLFVQQEVQDNSAIIGGGVPGGTVSWQVTGVRRDPYILANPIVPEVLKGPGQPVNKGECLYEPLCF
jgi:hypothetical protein